MLTCLVRFTKTAYYCPFKQKASLKMRVFNTSGPNIAAEHYTIWRADLILEGLDLVNHSRYFTIWAPRQTGKSTYFAQLSIELTRQGYQIAHLNFENYKDAVLSTFVGTLRNKLSSTWHIDLEGLDLQQIFEKITKIKDKKFVLIIDEVEGINPLFFGTFLHSIRNAYHSRQEHALKSVILVGVSNIVGVVQDNASPFNISENLNVPYFTDTETRDLLKQHEDETGQLFDEKVKVKIAEITANQPGLVNGFANKLVTDYANEKALSYEKYLKVEDWYLTSSIDKNISNIINKAQKHRAFLERLLFTPYEIPFRINRPEIKELFANGIIKKNDKGFVEFWVPIYKKALYDVFYPYTNGEQDDIAERLNLRLYFTPDGKINFDYLITKYKEYVQRRGFGVFREKDEKGKFTSIKEAALLYSFETYIQAFVQIADGKTYREADTGLGKSDLVINLNSEEFIIESKKYYSISEFIKGKKQLAYYCQKLGLTFGIYLVFLKKHIEYDPDVVEITDIIEGIKLTTYLIYYDEIVDFKVRKQD